MINKRLEDLPHAMLKLVEEMSELSNEIVTSMTKPDIDNVSKQALEAGDVILRMKYYLREMEIVVPGFTKDVKKAIKSKKKEIKEWRKTYSSKKEDLHLDDIY